MKFSRRVIASAVSLLSLIASNAAALTLTEAQTLPVQEVIKKSLGDLGDQFIDINRPTGFEDQLMFVRRNSKPKLSSITFYRKAHLSNSSGLCQSESLTLDYGNDGTVIGYSQYPIFGVVNGQISAPPVDFRMTLSMERVQNATCASAATTITFFSATPANPDLATRAALAAKMVQSQHIRGTGPSINLICGPVACIGPKSPLDRISPEAISSVAASDCNTKLQVFPAGQIPNQLCLHITLNQSGLISDDLEVETNFKNGILSLSNVSFSSMNMAVQ